MNMASEFIYILQARDLLALNKNTAAAAGPGTEYVSVTSPTRYPAAGHFA